jgi:hypothetical protein
MLADDEKGEFLGDFKQELQRTEIAIRNPEIALVHTGQHVVQQRPFLSDND